MKGCLGAKPQQNMKFRDKIMKTVENSTQHATFGYIKIMGFFFPKWSLKSIDFINRYNNFDKIMLN